MTPTTMVVCHTDRHFPLTAIAAVSAGRYQRRVRPTRVSCAEMEETPVSPQITKWLADWRQGDTVARDRLFAVMHPVLRQIAARFLHHERPDHTLEPNALVNELCLRLLGGQPIAFSDRRISWPSPRKRCVGF